MVLTPDKRQHHYLHRSPGVLEKPNDLLPFSSGLKCCAASHKRLRFFPVALGCSSSFAFPIEYASDLEKYSKTVVRFLKY
uniref:Uncharacterized protein n=1 Tax=Glossina morsitans morsitans TaxID=37546 RepID=A0A1B0FJF8_GLOMM